MQTAEGRFAALLEMALEDCPGSSVSAGHLIDELMGRREPDALSLMYDTRRTRKEAWLAQAESRRAMEEARKILKQCRHVALNGYETEVRGSWMAVEEQAEYGGRMEFRLLNELVDEGMAKGDSAFLTLMRNKLESKAKRYPVRGIILRIDEWGRRQIAAPAAPAAGEVGKTIYLKRIKYNMENKENDEGGFKVNVYSPGNVIAKEVIFNGPAYFGEGGTAEQTAPTTEAERHLTDEQIIAGVRRCQQYFWAGAAWAVIYRVLQNDYDDQRSVSQFEDDMLRPSAGLDFQCTPRAVAMGMQNNAVLRSKPEAWETQGAKSRIVTLRDEFRKALKEMK